MKTILYGPVTEAHLADASLFSGIDPTAFVTNGTRKPPATALPVETIPVCPLVGDTAGELQNHWRLVLAADALICVGENPHLIECAERYGLPIYEASQCG